MKFFTGYMLVALVVFSSSVLAAKLYKIVDGDGNVTFSQYPPSPSEKSEDLTIEEQQVEGGGKAVLTIRGETQYCGSIELPRERERHEYFYSEIASRMKYWENDLERKEKQLRKNQESYLKQAQYRSKYNSSSSSRQTAYYMENNKKTLESLRDIRCAINWGEEQQEGSSDAKQKMSEELNRLQKSLNAIHNQLLSKCGEEPIYDPVVKGNKQERRVWSKCSNQFKGDIRKLGQLIRKESRKLENF